MCTVFATTCRRAEVVVDDVRQLGFLSGFSPRRAAAYQNIRSTFGVIGLERCDRDVTSWSCLIRMLNKGLLRRYAHSADRIA
jgi:hypothetical protein